ncbi:lipid kinase [Gloeocapsopsis dulcis]|uniref:Lipid kinase n=1 Tax=Gloeocapsopsis dulcis AAB1 = 1H9 TaxID=1433147 RepID=A0A6N8FW26_9CHRO|nr:lipid kinase [Gloeocapsopsis dulcis]MUL37069.1 lipid kinase [Gloeocapsopsis dulcis AAB1 = 1H9]WNN87923.1 lipid kinase [Gloeocapsopsis dulcis]
MTRRALLLINRHARQGQNSQAIAQLQKLDLELILENIEDVRFLPEIIQSYKDKVDLVIVGGGDGTLNAAVDGLVSTQLPLGILPLGTANDLARTLGIPNSLSEACKIIASGNVQHIDLGWVNGKHFFNVASLGLSVQITQKLTKKAKRRWGVFAYAITAIKAMWQVRPFHAEIRLNGQTIQLKTIQIAIGNGRYYGGGMTIVHDAKINDQRLDVYSLEIQHWWQMLALLPALRRGRHTASLGVRTFHAQEIEVYTRKPRPINTDGEITTYTPAHFRVIPRALAVLVP